MYFEKEHMEAYILRKFYNNKGDLVIICTSPFIQKLEAQCVCEQLLRDFETFERNRMLQGKHTFNEITDDFSLSIY